MNRALLVLVLASIGQGCAASRPLPAVSVFYPAAPDTARYQFLDRITTSDDLRRQSWFSRVVLGKAPRQRLGKPYGVTVVGSRVFVADTQLKLVVRFDLAEREMRAFRDAGSLRFSSVINVEHDEAGRIYVADADGGRVVVMDADGNLLGTYAEDAELVPLDVGISADNVLVVDRVSHGVRVFDRTSGEDLGALDASADSIGFVAPTNVAVGPDGTVYVVDTMACRVLCFDRELRFAGAIGRQGYYPGMFVRPKGVAVDPDGQLLVVDSAFENVQVFRPDGRALTFLGGPGEAPGAMWLPAGVSVSEDLVPHLENKAHPGAKIRYVVVVASQFGPARLDFYGRIANVEEFARIRPPGAPPLVSDTPGLLPPGQTPPDVTGAGLGKEVVPDGGPEPDG